MDIKFGLSGRFDLWHFRQGLQIGYYTHKNGIVDEGLDNILDVYFGGSAQTDPWNAGLIDNAGFTALANADTMAAHGGWSELSAYTEAARVPWVDDPAAGGIKTNSVTDMDFTINATNTVNGIFLSSDGVKGGVAGLLWNTASFDTPIPVVNLDVLKVQYILTVSVV